MADIDQIIAGGSGATSRYDFSAFGDPVKSFFDANKQRAEFDTRRAFKDGVPMKDGQPDYPEMAKTFFQKGDMGQGVAAANLGLQQQNLEQNREAARYSATGGGTAPAQPAIVSPPSANRGASVPVAPALNKGGEVPQDQPSVPQGHVTPAAFLQTQGIQPGYNMEVGLAAFKRAGIEPDQPFNPNDPAISSKLAPVVQRLKGVGQVQPPQPGDNPPQPPPQQVAQAPQQPPQANPQAAAPSPFANAVAAGLIPPGVDPNRFVAGLKYRAAALPKGPAQEAIQHQVNAIDKLAEPTDQEKAFAASRRTPGLDSYTAQNEADKASAKAIAEGDVKEQQGIIDAGRAAGARLTTLNTVANIIQNDKSMTLGFGAETALKMKKALQQIGFDVGDLSGAQSIEKLNGMLAAESAKTVSPRPAQFEFKTFLNNNPGLSLDRAGNLRVIGIFSQLAKRDLDLGKLARQSRDNWSGWDNVVESYDKAHPIVDPVSKTPISTDSVIAPAPQGQTTKAQAPALEPGKTQVNGYVFKGGDPKNKANWELRS